MTKYSIACASMTVSLVLAVTVASAADRATLVGFAEAPGADRVMLVDQRPAEEKTESLGPLNILKCGYGVYRVADDATAPARLTLLGSDLAAALGAELDNRSIVVRHYGLYVNFAAEHRRGAAGAAAIAGASAAAAAGAGPAAITVPGVDRACPPEKLQGGWYGPGEAKTAFSPVIAELRVEVDGREYSVRAVVSSPTRFKKAPRAVLKDETFVPLLFEAMRDANANLVARLRSER